MIALFKSQIVQRLGTIKSVGALAAGNLLSSLLGAVAGLLVARFISPEVNGQFRLYTIPLMYLTFLHLGTFDGLYRQIPFYIGKNQPEQVNRMASSSGAWNWFVSVFVAFVFVCLALWCSLRGDWLGVAGWMAQAITCFSIFYGGYMGSTYRTLNNFVLLAKIQLVQAVIAFCLVLTVVFWGFYGLCLRSALPVLIAVIWFHCARPLKIDLRFDLSAFKDVIKVGAPLCFWGTLYSSIWTATEFALVLHFGGLKAVGLFSVAHIIRESFTVLPQAVHQVIMPRVVESFARHNGVGEYFKRTVWVTLGLGLLLCLLGAAALKYFVPVFLPRYTDGIDLMQICLYFSIVQALQIPLNGLAATGDAWLWGRSILVGSIVFVAFIFLLGSVLSGALLVVVSSLCGRIGRTVFAYWDFHLLLRRENTNDLTPIIKATCQ